MKCIMLVDFGSTYTKVTLVNPDTNRIVGTAKSETTVETDIMEGYKHAIKKLHGKLECTSYETVDCLVCSSAAGGLKMVASGLVKQLTAEAAKLACLGSGAKMLDVFSQKLTKGNIRAIRELKPDMLLLAGGTDGGNHECIIHNASILSKELSEIPFVAAGNKNATDDLEDIFEKTGICYRITDNVMPELNQINIEPARQAIREIFMDKIIEAKGLKEVMDTLSNEIIPTPMSVLKAAKLLAEGTPRQKGWGPLMVVDIGGATTDIHTACDGKPTRPGAVMKGLVEPYLKRTVEGDLGMRVSAESLMHGVGLMELKERTGRSFDYVEERCLFLAKHVDEIATCKEDIEFDEAMASAAVKTAVERHAGHIESVYSPMGMLFYQNGKDLSTIKTIIGTGGVIVYSEQAGNILEASLLDNEKPEVLKPKEANFYVDATYMLSAAGLLADNYPDLALNLMNYYLKEVR